MNRIKKYLPVVLILFIMCFLAAGCNGKSVSQDKLLKDSVNSNLKKQDNFSSSSINTNDTSSIKSKSSSSNTAKAGDEAATEQKLKEVSDQMDKLDNSLKGLDDSDDINTAESIINNIN